MPPDDAEKNPFERCPNFHHHNLTDTQIEQISRVAAEEAAKIVRRRFYEGVGSAVISKFLYIVGIAAIGVLSGLAATGRLNP